MNKAQSDTTLLVSLLVFLGAFLFLQAQFGTTAVSVESGWVGNYTTNSTQIAVSGEIKVPPTCEPATATGNWARDVMNSIFEGGSCIADWSGWLASLMYFKSTVNWLNTLILAPLLIAIAYLIARFGRGLA